MLQALLADRFGLVATNTTRELPALLLALESGELKFPLATEDTPKPQRYFRNAGDGTANFTANLTMDELAQFLSGWFNKSVLNQTGLTERYLLRVAGLHRSSDKEMFLLSP